MKVALLRYLAALARLLAAWIYIFYDLLENTWYLLNQSRFVSGSEKRAVLITGCDTGFGALAAKSFADRKVPVFAGCLTEQGIAALVQHNKEIMGFHYDVTDPASTSAAVDFASRTCESRKLVFWALINNAGIAPPFVLADWQTYSDMEKTIKVTLLGQMQATLAFLPLIKASVGRIIFVSSVLGYVHIKRSAAYAAAKHGVTGFAHVLRVELRETGVKVVIIAPGFHSSALTLNGCDSMVQHWQRLSPSLKQEYPLEKVSKYTEQSLSSLRYLLSTNRVEEVVEAYFHGAYGTCPRSSYFIGIETPLVETTLLVPDSVRDAFVRWLT